MTVIKLVITLIRFMIFNIWIDFIWMGRHKTSPMWEHSFSSSEYPTSSDGSKQVLYKTCRDCLSDKKTRPTWYHIIIFILTRLFSLCHGLTCSACTCFLSKNTSEGSTRWLAIYFRWPNFVRIPSQSDGPHTINLCFFSFSSH